MRNFRSTDTAAILFCIICDESFVVGILLHRSTKFDQSHFVQEHRQTFCVVSGTVFANVYLELCQICKIHRSDRSAVGRDKHEFVGDRGIRNQSGELLCEGGIINEYKRTVSGSRPSPQSLQQVFRAGVGRDNDNGIVSRYSFSIRRGRCGAASFPEGAKEVPVPEWGFLLECSYRGLRLPHLRLVFQLRP